MRLQIIAHAVEILSGDEVFKNVKTSTNWGNTHTLRENCIEEVGYYEYANYSKTTPSSGSMQSNH
jgi:hypothetical protein